MSATHTDAALVKSQKETQDPSEIQAANQALLLAHRFSLNAHCKLGDNHLGLIDVPIIEVQRSLLDSFKTYCKEHQKQIHEIIQKECADLTITPEETRNLMNEVHTILDYAFHPDQKRLMENIQNGEISSLAFFTRTYDLRFQTSMDHLEGVVFQGKDALIRINRDGGAGGVQGFEINQIGRPENLEKYIERLAETYSGVEFYLNSHENYKLFASLLELKKQNSIYMKPQRVPNCKWVTLKALNYANLYAVLFRFYLKKGLEPSSAEKAALKVSRIISKDFSVKDRLQYLQIILSSYPSDMPISKFPSYLKDILVAIYTRALAKPKYQSALTLLKDRGVHEMYELYQKFNSALSGNDLKEVEDCLNEGANPNQVLLEKRNFSPLLWAVFYRNIKMIELLKRFGADVNMPCGAYINLLGVALNPHKDIDLYKYLISIGVKPTESQTRDLKTLLAEKYSTYKRDSYRSPSSQQQPSQEEFSPGDAKRSSETAKIMAEHLTEQINKDKLTP